MKLEDIGFYTLSDNRAKNISLESDLYRCELILTDRCNFKCPYCRGLKPDLQGTVPINHAKEVVQYWLDDGLKNIRFSGGEPTLYRGLIELITICKESGVEHIAVSTNGSVAFSYYEKLIAAGVNDFSISLDGACCSVGDKMAGGIDGAWERVVENIKRLSERTYVTVGMVFTEENIEDCVKAVLFADSLGVSDIRVIPSAQYNQALKKLSDLPEAVLDKYPILKYRIDNLNNGRHVRGIVEGDDHKCWLVLDDMAVAGGYHFPCIIYMREQGDPIGKVGPKMREERFEWMKKHTPCEDNICKNNCLDVCCDINNRIEETHFIDDAGELVIKEL